MNTIFQKTTQLALIVTLVFGFFACGESKTTAEQDTAVESNAVEVQSGPDMGPIIDAYLAVKEAFVASDANLTKEKAGELAKAASSLSNGSIASIVNEIKSTDGIDEQRVQFEKLTEAVLALVESQGTGGKIFIINTAPWLLTIRALTGFLMKRKFAIPILEI